MTVMDAMDLLPELRRYTTTHSTPPDALVAELVERTHAQFGDQARMQIAPEQSTLLGMLAKLVGARHILEVGTFTGLSSLSFARTLPADGHLLCLDISEEFTSVAREFWERAGVADRIELRIGPAAPALAALPKEPYLDLVFLDADKQNQLTYWSEAVPRVRQGGLIIVDNVLWRGEVVDPPADAPLAQVVADFNDAVAKDERVDTVMLFFGDGLTLARKR